MLVLSYKYHMSSFKSSDNDPTRKLVLHVIRKYYMLLEKTRELNALIDNKPFFDPRFKSKQEMYEKFVEISGNNYNPTRNLIDY